MATQTDNPLAHRVESVARKLDISRAGAWRLIAKGAIKAVRIGNRTVVRDSDLRDFVESLPSSREPR
jgi:excisionase family DNA binding protein